MTKVKHPRLDFAAANRMLMLGRIGTDNLLPEGELVEHVLGMHVASEAVGDDVYVVAPQPPMVLDLSASSVYQRMITDIEKGLRTGVTVDEAIRQLTFVNFKQHIINNDMSSQPYRVLYNVLVQYLKSYANALYLEESLLTCH